MAEIVNFCPDKGPQTATYFEKKKKCINSESLLGSHFALDQLNWTEKFVDSAQQCFAFLHMKPKFKFAEVDSLKPS